MDAINLTQHSFALKAKYNPDHRFRDLYHLICQQEWLEYALSAVYERQQEGQRKNLAVSKGKGQTIFLYRMADLPITQYRTRNYPNPYLEAITTMTQIEDEPLTPLQEQMWSGGSANTEWNELRRQILHRDDYKCQSCGNTVKLEVHHLQARSQGGLNDPPNLVTLCQTCHIQTDEDRANFVRQSK